ncbi:cytochrome c oxidase subunit 4 [Nocardioidaceae bacterium]|nr:cytochrome c oxidase subunit 4 [Nocardioidaceae bacterium]
MKVEAWVFGVTAAFVWLFSPLYWFLSGDWTGTTALVMTALLASMGFGYLYFHASRMTPRPEDKLDGEIAEGAGELGFFPPFSWWPLWCAACLGVMVLGTVFGWWLFGVGFILGGVATAGLVFEYYRGEFAH